MDFDVSNYTDEELAQLINITELDEGAIHVAVDQQIAKHSKNKEYVQFFKDIRDKLINSVKEEPAAKTIQVEVKKGTINPDLKTTVTRLINVDSSHRSILNSNNTPDSYVFELTEPLLNVISMSLYSIEIPQSWYTCSLEKGTVGFILCRTDTDTTRYSLRIPDGNYTTFSLITAFISAINSNTELSALILASSDYNANTGKVTISFTSQTPQPIMDIYQIIWVESTYSDPNMVNNKYNSSLGWLLGFRLPIAMFGWTDPTIPGRVVSATAQSLVDASGTKYITLSLDDYKTNRLNRSIVSVNTTPKTPISLPTYYNESIPQYRDGTTRVHVIQSDPRSLTAKQIFTINAISDQQLTNQQILAQRFITYDSSNLLAKISLKRTDWGKTTTITSPMEAIDNGPGRLIPEASGPLQQQMREYFGPVDINTMAVSLYDDKGNLLGLNGMDWSFSLLVKCIYQY